MPKMDRKSWPWKKKSSDKSSSEKANATLGHDAASLPSGGSQSDKDKYGKPNYVQIPAESYAHLAGLEEKIKTYEEQLKISNEQVKTSEEKLKINKEQVRTYEEQVKTYEDQLKTLDEQIDELNEKLSDAHTEMTNKEQLVKQHAKVAEEAVSGWEKAESEAAALKTHLEAVTLSKMTAEDRAAHLDGALKECMRQIRNLKEEHEQKIQDVVRRKDAQYDKMRREFEARITEMDHEILRSEAENDALSRSLQDRSAMLIKVTEEKSQAEAEIEHLKNNIETCEREINTLKYELHIVSKEMDIRNEEKNMSMKSAEAANKQHMEGVKKIAKLEAECQRLRGLVRKKLPGPAALAQMKVEVESLGRDFGGETRRRSPVRPGSPLLSPHRLLSPSAEFSLDGAQKSQKENEYLTERLLAMEEETKMLKEALSRRNGELQASRSMYAKTASKLQSIEVQIHKQKDCVTSLSEEGNDDTVSVAESWASAMVPRSRRTDSTSQLELMDDFLEMERLANLSNGDANPSSAMKLQQRISKVFQSMSDSSDLAKIIGEIDRVVKETCDPQNPESCVLVEKHCSEDAVITSEKGKTLSKELETAISEIHTFVLSIGKEAAAFQKSDEEEDGLSSRVELFTGSLDKVFCNKMSLDDFVVSLANVMVKISDLSFNFTGYKASSPDCIDIKVALSDSSSNPEFPSEAPLKCSLEEYERMKAEKDEIERELETTKSQLKESEQALAEVRLQLESSQRSNSLAETQLKCMAESYKGLEKRSEELQVEVNLLRTKAESLEIELESEKIDHQDALAKCKDLEEQVKRNEECSLCSSMAADLEDKSKQEKELADAAEKLAECQDTIFLLAKQLNSMHSQTDAPASPPPVRAASSLKAEKPEISGEVDQDLPETDIYNAHFCPSDSEVNSLRRPATGLKSPKHRHTKSGSSSTASTPTPEKHARGFSRFFSSKGSGRH